MHDARDYCDKRANFLQYRNFGLPTPDTVIFPSGEKHFI